MMDALTAARAYGAASGVSSAGQAAGQAAAAVSTGGFDSMLGSVMNEAGQSLANAEAMSQAAVAGEAQLPDVVAAVAEAELTLETMVAVRDQVVRAYQEIMRMPV